MNSVNSVTVIAIDKDDIRHDITQFCSIEKYTIYERNLDFTQVFNDLKLTVSEDCGVCYRLNDVYFEVFFDDYRFIGDPLKPEQKEGFYTVVIQNRLLKLSDMIFVEAKSNELDILVKPVYDIENMTLGALLEAIVDDLGIGHNTINFFDSSLDINTQSESIVKTEINIFNTIILENILHWGLDDIIEDNEVFKVNIAKEQMNNSTSIIDVLKLLQKLYNISIVVKVDSVDFYSTGLLKITGDDYNIGSNLNDIIYGNFNNSLQSLNNKIGYNFPITNKTTVKENVLKDYEIKSEIFDNPNADKMTEYKSHIYETIKIEEELKTPVNFIIKTTDIDNALTSPFSVNVYADYYALEDSKIYSNYERWVYLLNIAEDITKLEYQKGSKSIKLKETFCRQELEEFKAVKKTELDLRNDIWRISNQIQSRG